MKRILFITIIIVLFSLKAYADLKIGIAIDQTSLGEAFIKSGGELQIFTTITNAGTEPYEITVYICSYGRAWMANREEILISVVVCDKNFPVDIVLKPGEEYKRTLPIAIASSAKSGPLRFKLGFSPKQEEFQTRIWSNPVEFNLEPDMVKFLKYSPDMQAKPAHVELPGTGNVEDLPLEDKIFLLRSGIGVPPPCSEGSYQEGNDCKLK